MSTSSIGSGSDRMIQALVGMRSQFDDLQRQLSTGQKSDTYSGLGLGTGLSVGLNAQMSALSSYDTSIDTAMTRINLAQQALSGMSSLGNTVNSAIVQANGSVPNFSNAVTTAQSSLQQILGMLNTQAGNRYLFSGRATDTPSVASYDLIMNGDGTHAGLKQLISERNQADLGASGLGRLTVSAPAAGSVAVQEDAGPFGFKLSAANSNLTNATVTGPSGSPAGLTVAFTGQPNDGETIGLTLNLPDGSTQTLALTATTQAPPGANQFLIGANATQTASNLQSALTTVLGALAGSTLKAASTMAASTDFFNADSSNPPQRVVGPPFDTATALAAGTSGNTVIWYTGEAAPDPARASATARIDPSVAVSYGTRANEQGIKSLIASVAAIAGSTVSSSDPNAADFTSALTQRTQTALNGTGGGQTITDIGADLAGVQVSMKNMKSRHQQATQTLTDMLQQITGVSNEEIGAQLLKLQTQMQASMQTTAMLLQTNLVHYLTP
jgi:flagellin-like hook-associated protein FlgL